VVVVETEEFDYDRVFDLVIRDRWEALQESDRDNADRSGRGRRGNLSPSDDAITVLTDVYKYQRSHIDAFVKAMAAVEIARPTDAVDVVDIGAGANTVAIAMSEHWAEAASHVQYRPVEPNPHMRRYGSELLRVGGWSGCFDNWFADVSELPVLSELRLLVTLSYLVHQPTVTDGDVADWAEFIASSAEDMELEVLLTTAITTDRQFNLQDRTTLLKSEVEGRGRTVEELQHELRVPLRFPSEDGGWTTRQPGRSPGWRNVMVRYWRVQ
jgi:hypothetical protein